MILLAMLCSLFMVIDYCGSFCGKSSYTCYPLSSKWCKNASWIAFQKQEPDYDYPHEVLYINTVKLSLCRDKKHFHGSVQL